MKKKIGRWEKKTLAVLLCFSLGLGSSMVSTAANPETEEKVQTQEYTADEDSSEKQNTEVQGTDSQGDFSGQEKPSGEDNGSEQSDSDGKNDGSSAETGKDTEGEGSGENGNDSGTITETDDETQKAPEGSEEGNQNLPEGTEGQNDSNSVTDDEKQEEGQKPAEGTDVSGNGTEATVPEEDDIQAEDGVSGNGLPSDVSGNGVSGNGVEKTEKPAFFAEKSIDGVTITLKAEEGVLPEGTVATVTDVTEAEKESVIGKKQTSDETVTDALVYDINLYYNDEKLTWEEGTVQVSFSGEPVEKIADQSDKLEIACVDGEAYDTVSVQDVQKAEVSAVSFDAEHFTNYALVGVREAESYEFTINFYNVKIYTGSPSGRYVPDNQPVEISADKTLTLSLAEIPEFQADYGTWIKDTRMSDALTGGTYDLIGWKIINYEPSWSQLQKISYCTKDDPIEPDLEYGAVLDVDTVKMLQDENKFVTDKKGNKFLYLVPVWQESNSLAFDPNQGTYNYDSEEGSVRWKAQASDLGSTSEGIDVSIEQLDSEGLYETAYEITVTIPEGYNASEIKINLTDVLMQGIQNTEDSVHFLPGDSIDYRIRVINHSGYEYGYLNGSVKVSTISEESEGSVLCFDGKRPADSWLPDRTQNEALKALYEASGNLSETAMSDEKISEKLVELGYEGIGQLNHYYLDYYNSNSGSDTPATRIEELEDAALRAMFGENNNFYINETNEEVSATGYNWFYNAALLVDCGDGDDTSFSVGAHMRDNSHMNNKFNQGIGTIGTGAEKIMETNVKLHGLNTPNSYQNFEYGFGLAFTLDRIDPPVTPEDPDDPDEEGGTTPYTPTTVSETPAGVLGARVEPPVTVTAEPEQGVLGERRGAATGDETPIGIWMLAAAAAAAGVFAITKRKNKNSSR